MIYIFLIKKLDSQFIYYILSNSFACLFLKSSWLKLTFLSSKKDGNVGNAIIIIGLYSARI